MRQSGYSVSVSYTHLCSNADIIRNHAYCWSRMSAVEISEKTGIEQRRYTQLPLEDMALLAAKKALTKSGRRPAEIGAVLLCTCTSTKLIPSIATWLSGELGLLQTHASCDIVAACAGMPYGLAEAVRLLQEINRPVLLVCAEKFSDKIGTVRTSRMIFGDGAAAVVVAPAPEGTPSDIEIFQTYASGPWSEVNSIIWPNPEFDNSITVYGPEVKALVTRYLKQMMGELAQLPNPNGGGGSLIDAIDIVVPHQANKNMVLTLAEAAGIPSDRIFFNIERVGNTSSASILMAVHDACLLYTSRRDPAKWRAALKAVEDTARGTGNLMPVIVEAVEADATVGEISDAMRRVYGEYHETVVI